MPGKKCLWPPNISGNLITLTDVLYIMATSPDTAESHKKNHRCHCSFPLIKRCANFVIIFLVISPAAIAYWRGTWLLMDVYFYPKNPHLSAWISTALGLGVACVVVFLQEQWRKLLKKCSFPLNAVMWRIFVYPLAFCVVSAWRGVWTILGLYVSERYATMYALATHCFGFVILVMTKTTSTIIFSPGFTLSDKCFVPAELNFPTQSLPVLEKAYFGRVILKVWNCFLTVLVIGIAGIGYWRGTWTLVDIFTLCGQENDRLKSTILSLAVGYSIVVVCFCICEIVQKKIDIPMSRLCYVVEMIFIYVLVFGVVNIWRAGFYIQDDFLLPDDVASSAWLSHGVGFGVLLVGQGLVNLIGSPVGCRIHKPGAPEGFYMGEYLDMTHANSEGTQKKVDSDKEPTENIAETAKQEKTEQ